MIDAEIDKAWSLHVAAIVTATLVVDKVLAESDKERATAICAEEIMVRLVMGDRPDRDNWKYKSN